MLVLALQFSRDMPRSGGREACDRRIPAGPGGGRKSSSLKTEEKTRVVVRNRTRGNTYDRLDPHDYPTSAPTGITVSLTARMGGAGESAP